MHALHTLSLVVPSALALLGSPVVYGKPGDPPPPWSLAEADPELEGVVENRGGAFAGYTLIAPLNDTSTYLIDMQGEVVHAWAHDSSPAGGTYLLEDGSLLRCGREDESPKFRGGGVGGRIQKLAPDGTLLWSWSLADGERCQHHDLAPLPNGNVLVIAWERKSAAEAVARGRHPRHVGAAGLWPDMLLEVKPVLPDGAEIVWEWHAWDHLIQDVDPQLAGYGSIPDDPGRLDVNFDHREAPPPTAEEIEAQRLLEEQMAAVGYAGGDDEDEDEPEPGESKWDKSGDWLHTNAVDYHAGEDLIVLSSPRLSEVFVIDHSTTTAEAATDRGGRRGRGGRILWRWGNPRNHGQGKQADQRLFYQHNSTWLAGEAPGELRLLVFNNGSFDDRRRHSSVEELVLPFDPERGFARAEGVPGPDEPAWSYSDGDGFFSAFISGAQRLPNGNTLVCSGAPGRVFEVTRAGEVVWDYRNRLGGTVTPPDHAGHAPPHALFRASRLAADDPGVRAVLD